MAELYEKYKGQVEFVGISTGPRDSIDDVRSFIQGYKFSWTFVHDKDNLVVRTYQVNSVPTSYFLDQDGVIRAIHIGAMNHELIEGYLRQVRPK